MANAQINFLHLIQNNPISANIEANFANLHAKFSEVWRKNPDTLILTPEFATTGRIISDRIDLYIMQEQIEAQIAKLLEIMPADGAVILGTAFMCDDFFKPVFLILQNNSYTIYDYKLANADNTIIKVKDKTLLLLCEDRLKDSEYIFNLPNVEVDFAYVIGDSFYTHTYMDTLEENDINCDKLADDYQKESWYMGYDAKVIQERLQDIMQDRTKHGLAYLNLAGATDGYINRGCSFYINAKGNLITEANLFTEDSLIIELAREDKLTEVTNTQLPRLEYLKQALVIGIQDYVEKNKFDGVVLGISGGIDSALVAALAVEALGKDRVHGFILPYKYTSQLSIDLAEQLIANLGINSSTIRLDNLMQAVAQDLNIDENSPGVAWQNAQARSRALLMITSANLNNWLLLATGNKSELSMGYSTLYGDLAGGFAPLKDLYKTQVFALAKYLNETGTNIPEQIITRTPTAELAYNQKDEDSLPPYDILDQILYYYLDEKIRLKELVNLDYPEDLIKKILKTYNFYEFKRRQAPPGIELNCMPQSFISHKVINNGFCNKKP